MHHFNDNNNNITDMLTSIIARPWSTVIISIIAMETTTAATLLVVTMESAPVAATISASITTSIATTFTASVTTTVTTTIATTLTTTIAAILMRWPVAIVVIRRCGRRHIDTLRGVLNLTLLVEINVVEDGGGVRVRVNDLHDLLTLRIVHLLGVTRMRHRLVLVVLQPNVTQLCVRHILDVHPFEREFALPLVLMPNGRHRIVVNGAGHLSDAAKVAGSVHREQQKDFGAVTLCVAERLIQPLVTVLGGAPDAVLDAAMDVVLRIGFDDKESGDADEKKIKTVRGS